MRLPGWLHCPEGSRPPDAARRAPASVEYLWRNTGLDYELFISSSEHCNFTSRSPDTPGWRGRLPARAPLRTVLESFPSYGSSPHKAGSAVGRPAVGCSITRARTTWPYCSAAAPRCAPLKSQLWDASTDGRRSSFASPACGRFLGLSGHFGPDRRGHIQRITAGLGFFGHPKAAPPDPPCGKVRPVTRPGGASSVSMFCKVHRMI